MSTKCFGEGTVSAAVACKMHMDGLDEGIKEMPADFFRYLE